MAIFTRGKKRRLSGKFCRDANLEVPARQRTPTIDKQWGDLANERFDRLYPGGSRGPTTQNHRLARRLLGGQRRARARAVFDRRHRRHGRHPGVRRLVGVDVFGFVQSFTYAEIAGLFPNKSGGASVYGAAAWLKYSKVIASLSVWCNWLAWTPVLSLGCTIAAGYILNALAPIPAAGFSGRGRSGSPPTAAGRAADASPRSPRRSAPWSTARRDSSARCTFLSAPRSSSAPSYR